MQVFVILSVLVAVVASVPHERRDAKPGYRMELPKSSHRPRGEPPAAALPRHEKDDSDEDPESNEHHSGEYGSGPLPQGLKEVLIPFVEEVVSNISLLYFPIEFKQISDA